MSNDEIYIHPIPAEIPLSPEELKAVFEHVPVPWREITKKEFEEKYTQQRYRK